MASTEQRALRTAFDAFAHVSRDLEQAYTGLTARVAELTERVARTDRELESRLAASRALAQRFEGLLAALPVGVIVLDGCGRVQVCNPAARCLLGTGPRGLLGRPWRTVVATAFDPQPDDGHDITVRGGQRVNLSTSSLPEAPGQIVVLTDVSETRRLQEEAARLERLTDLGRAVAGIAHQIRTPLAAALLHASSLPAGERVRARLLDRLRAIESLVVDMLGFARSGELSVEPLEVETLICALVARQLPGPVPVVGPGPGDDLPGGARVLGHREALESILQNLVDNAREAPGATRVSLQAEPDRRRGEIRLVCSDDGAGVPEVLRRRIFEPFFTTRACGTGLGLAMVRAVAEAHGGRVELESPDTGGARFSLVLKDADAGGSEASPIGAQGGAR